MTLSLGPGLKLPADFATRRAAIIAMSGGGKTYTAAVLAEEFVKAGQPFYALDPTGAWWGLRSSASGKGKGLPVIVIGGEHGDVPLDEHAGAAIADLVVGEPSFYVVDLDGIDTHAGEVRFATAFLDRLYRQKSKQRSALHGFWDEADLFAPQRPGPEQTKMLGAAEAIIRRGRIRGLGTTLITQRPAVLNKNVLTQIDVLIALKVIGPQDRKAIREYLDGVADPDRRDEVLDSLAGLNVGEAWVYGPGLQPALYQRVKVRERDTFNSSATGGGAQPEVTLADVDLDALHSRLAASIEKARAEDPRELQRRVKQRDAAIADLRAQLERAQQETPPPERVEVPVLTDEAREVLDKAAGAIVAAKEQMIDAIAEASVLLGGLIDELGVRSQPTTPASHSPRPAVPRPHPARPITPTRAASPRPASGAGGAVEGDLPQIKAGARRMLAAVASLHPMPLTRAQIGALAKVKRTGGTFGTYLSVLKQRGLIVENGDQVTITAAGFDELGERPAAPATADELRELWRDRLKAGARRMLDELIAHHPHWLTREDLAERAEITMSGGTYGTYLGMLRTAGLIDEGQGMVRANDVLFLGVAGAHHG